MSWSNNERLYNLLPAVHRVRDHAQGEPLRALLSIIESEFEVLEADVEGLYDDWFIETAAEWVIPYIGDLLGVRGLHTVGSAGTPLRRSLRAYVANTLAYRRRKGTATVLEQLARDVTGWPARAVEFFQLLGTTQHLNHLRLDNLATVDVRDRNAMELLGGPFETAAHTVDVRHIAGNHGRYNIPNVGIYLWRLQNYPMERSVARAVGSAADARYTFNPHGCNAPLFNNPQTETEITYLAQEINVPGVLRRYPLMQELEAMRQAIVEGMSVATARRQSGYFGTVPVFQVFVDDVEIPPEEILICNLATWRRPPPDKTYTFIEVQPDGTRVEQSDTHPIAVAVDPALGRLTFPSGVTPGIVHVSYSYGFSGDIGGGPYDRRDTLADRGAADLFIPVQKGTVIDTIQKALQAWTDAGMPRCIIQIQDNEIYGGNIDITLPNEGWLTIEAADGYRPSVRTVGNTTLDGPETALLVLSGLLIEGALELRNDLELHISHCTLVPGRMLNEDCSPAFPDRDSIVGGASIGAPEVHIRSSMVGPIRLPETADRLAITDSIVDAPAPGGVTRPAIAADDSGAIGPTTTLERCTLFGPVFVRELTLASEVVFTERVYVERRQAGCVRFSYVPPASRTPRRYRCQPDLGLREAREAKGSDLTEAEAEAIRSRLQPRFTSTNYADPAYAQLSRICAEEIGAGAEDGSEMGVFSLLKQPQREANVRAALDEYLRFGLEAGLIFVT